MAYPVLQVFDLLPDGRYILQKKYIVNHLALLGGILRTSHTSIIFIATPIASRINGTGMRVAADCNNVKACFPVAVIYFVVVGMTSLGFSDNFWIHMCVREMERLIHWINPLTALEFVSLTWSSTDVYSFVAETIASSFSGSFWTQLVVKTFAQPELIDAHLRFRLEFPRHEQRTPGETSGRHGS